MSDVPEHVDTVLVKVARIEEKVDGLAKQVSWKVDALSNSLNMFTKAVLDPTTGMVPRSELMLMAEVAEDKRDELARSLADKQKQIDALNARMWALAAGFIAAVITAAVANILGVHASVHL